MAEYTKIFLDTEFTNLDNAQLISIGLVADNQKEIYLQSNEWEDKNCSNFCREKVLPLLNTDITNLNLSVISEKLHKWFSQFEKVTIMVDNNIDIRLFVNLFKSFPENIEQAYNINEYINVISKSLWFNQYPNHYQEAANKLINRFFYLTTQYCNINQLSSHHALHDAQANQYAFKEIENYFNYPLTQILQKKLSY